MGALIAILIVVLTAWFLLKKYNPQAVLLISGLLMLLLSMFLNNELPLILSKTGFKGFDLFRYVTESFSKTNAGVGLMIMSIGGFVAYIDKIGASNVLVDLVMKPLKLLRKRPYLAASFVIPLGQILFIAIPSAAGLGLLLMASLFPILLKIGVSRLSAVSVITATTAFGIGPASAITAKATQIAQVDTISFFVSNQLPIVVPLSISMMISYYFVNRFFDSKQNDVIVENIQKPISASLPKIYAIIPVLPIFLLLIFSSIFNFFTTQINLDTTTAMFISVLVAVIFELIRTKDFRASMNSLKTFWEGMGNIFKTVVTLIISADIFAKGLISLGFIDFLIIFSQSIGLGVVGIGIVMTIMIFIASMLMGSGNASFFAFGPLVPKITSSFGVESTNLILPMQLSASMGRAVSPVSGVIIATAEIANVSPFSIVKRNLIPLAVALILLLVLNNF